MLLRRVFKLVNKVLMVPLFRLGLGPLMVNPFSGYIMVIRTVGRRTGKVRYTPVNYALLDGCVYCLAGWGEISHWVKNMRAHPHIELILPGGAIAGAAEDVTDPAEALRAARQVLRNGGFAGFFMGFNPFTAPDDVVREKIAATRVVRIRPAGIGSGPADAGGWLWLLVVFVTLVLIILGVRLL